MSWAYEGIIGKTLAPDSYYMLLKCESMIGCSSVESSYHDSSITCYLPPQPMVIDVTRVRRSIWIYLCREKTKDALVPPKPNELDMATSTCLSCDWRGTKLKSVPTFGLCRFSVGGTAF